MRRLLAVLACAMLATAVHAQDVRVAAAGSLRAALTEIGREFEAAEPGHKVVFTFGASGLLRERLAGGEAADVFASANMEHPQALAASGGWTPVRAFARNALCALAPARLGLSSETLVATLLDPAIKMGTSTPKADPSGDYAFAMFARIAAQPDAPADARERLERKALQLTGGPSSPQPPAGRSVYGDLVARGAADVFITYCTNAAQAVAEDPQLRSVQVAPAINVGADYGLTVRMQASAAARRFAEFVLSAKGRQVLARHGFLEPA